MPSSAWTRAEKATLVDYVVEFKEVKEKDKKKVKEGIVDQALEALKTPEHDNDQEALGKLRMVCSPWF